MMSSTSEKDSLILLYMFHSVAKCIAVEADCGNNNKFSLSLIFWTAESALKLGFGDPAPDEP